MDYTIDGFWKARLSAIEKIQHFAPRPGWSDANARLEAFEEAGLSLRPDYTDLTQPVWLIAAPGAVGKSTLAQQLNKMGDRPRFSVAAPVHRLAAAIRI